MSGGAKKRYRAAAIGHTGRGNYGHSLHLAYRDLPNVDFVALSDPDPVGRDEAVAQTNAARGYANYREMLVEESLDIVSVCPRWVNQHEDMVMACIASGCHVYCEKPMTADLASADRVVEAAKSAGVKIAVAHQGVYLPQVHAMREMISSGRIGRLIGMEAWGKQDHRGGGEDTLVLGTHLFNMMRFFAGNPKGLMAYVSTEGRAIARIDAREANEPIGLIAGDSVTATYFFENGVTGHFSSRKDQPGKGRGYGLVLVGETASLAIGGNVGHFSIMDSAAWAPWEAGQAWQNLDVPSGSLHGDGNRLAIEDLVASIQNDRPPISSATDARWALEMIHGIYASHLSVGRVELPLSSRLHPLAR